MPSKMEWPTAAKIFNLKPYVFEFFCFQRSFDSLLLLTKPLLSSGLFGICGGWGSRASLARS